MSNFEYSQATWDWIKAGEEREEEAYQEYLRREKFEKELQWHKETINSANKEYAQFLLSQGFVLIDEGTYSDEHWYAIHKDYVEIYVDCWDRWKIPDWAIIEITEEVYEAKGE